LIMTEAGRTIGVADFRRAMERFFFDAPERPTLDDIVLHLYNGRPEVPASELLHFEHAALKPNYKSTLLFNDGGDSSYLDEVQFLRFVAACFDWVLKRQLDLSNDVRGYIADLAFFATLVEHQGLRRRSALLSMPPEEKSMSLVEMTDRLNGMPAVFNMATYSTPESFVVNSIRNLFAPDFAMSHRRFIDGFRTLLRDFYNYSIPQCAPLFIEILKQVVPPPAYPAIPTTAFVPVLIQATDPLEFSVSTQEGMVLKTDSVYPTHVCWMNGAVHIMIGQDPVVISATPSKAELEGEVNEIRHSNSASMLLDELKALNPEVRAALAEILSDDITARLPSGNKDRSYRRPQIKQAVKDYFESLKPESAP
jgi:hypothetical protein